jgi:ABC-2 type transport system permease protein
MRAVLLLLGKDLLMLRRSPGVLIALVLYPLVVALIVGLVVRYAGDRPRLALVDEDGLPQVVEVGGVGFDIELLLDRAAEGVDIEQLPRAEAERQLANGEVLGIIVIPDGFQRDIRGMVRQPEIALVTTESGLSTRIVEKVESLIYRVNLGLQRVYIGVNLDYIRLLLEGGEGSFLGDRFDVMGLEEAGRRLELLAESADPEVRAEAEDLATFVAEAKAALAATDESLRATANPIKLVREGDGGRALLLSAQVQAYALALTLAFVALLLAAAGIASERDERVFGRLTRGLLSLRELVAEKVAFVALVGAAIGAVLTLVFGLVVEIGDVAGGEPWARLPVVVLGLLLGGAAFAALGVVIGALAREARTATLLAFLVALPIVLLGLVPAGIVDVVGGISLAFPFAHVAKLVGAALGHAEPTGEILREFGWLAGLTLGFGLLARLSVRRLAT